MHVYLLLVVNDFLLYSIINLFYDEYVICDILIVLSKNLYIYEYVQIQGNIWNLNNVLQASEKTMTYTS